jgi:hypothetical protein
LENHTDYVGKLKTGKAYKLLKYKEFGPVGEWLSIGLTSLIQRLGVISYPF